MWPKLTNIEKPIVNSINSRRDIHKATNMNVWLRVFSGAGSGLIMTSNNNFELFKAAGEGASIYGSPNSVGTIGTDWNGNPIFGGSDRALRPSPGIVSFTVKEGKDQISKEANLQIKCFSLQQMEIVQKYFLEPGYSLCVEWGWNTPEGGMGMIDTGAGILSQCTERNLNYDVLHSLRVKSNGDYDTFFGFIVGGSVSNDGEQFNVDVRLKGAPGLPTYLQSQVHIQKQKSSGEIVESGKSNPYAAVDTENEEIGKSADRRFKAMYNNLPAHRQITQVDDLKTKVRDEQFINVDEFIKKKIIESAGEDFWETDITEIDFGSLGGLNPFSGGQGLTVEIKPKLLGSSIPGVKISKEKLYSKNRYIKMDLAIDILNANGGLVHYKMGDKEVGVGINISKAKIGAFPKMFSTKASALVIPGEIPAFREYYFNDGTIEQLPNGTLQVSGKGTIAPDANHAINGISFVQGKNLTKDIDNDGLAEKQGYWGYLKDLYVNLDMLIAKTQQPNKNIREVLLDILNEMSAAVNSFWHFQLVERILTEKEGNLKKGDVVITIIDENWIGENPNDSIEFFYHTGERSPFLESTLDLSIPADMANKIINERLSISSQYNSPFISTAKGGFFASEPDMFLKAAKKYNVSESGNNDETKKEDKIDEPPERTSATVDGEIKAIGTITSKGPFGADAHYDYYINDEKVAYTDGRITQYKQLVDEKNKLVAEENEKAAKASVAAIAANLAKIEIVPNPMLTVLDKTDLDADLQPSNPDGFANTYKIYCFDDKSFFDRLKNDAFINKGGMSHPLPIKYTFKTLGISGLRRGDTFVIKGIPDKYNKNGLFQITQIEHTLSGMLWTTSVTGEFRAKQSKQSGNTAATSPSRGASGSW
jgi:hypothetical protein